MRVSEIYASSQGEGPNVGKTTVFVRFGGCNLRCPGWPCDTQHAIDPTYRKEWTPMDLEEIVTETVKAAEHSGAQWITLTGGEPFLQRHDNLHEYVHELIIRGYEVECFSNGTFVYPIWATRDVNFIMDWKLPGSGEDPLNPNRLRNLRGLNNSITEATFNQVTPKQHAVKFVIKDHADLHAAHGLWVDHMRDAASQVEVFYGKVWQGQLSDADLVAYVMKNGLPWRLNVQVHQHVWPPDERGR